MNPYRDVKPERDTDVAVGNNKTFTVPAGQLWIPYSIFADILCTATVGNRYLHCKLEDASSVCIWRGIPSAVGTAGQRISGLWARAWGGYNTTIRTTSAGSTPNISVTESLPDMMCNTGWTFRIYDIGNIDANDTLKVYIIYGIVNLEGGRPRTVVT